MARVIDRTLSCLDDMPLNAPVLARFLELLVMVEPDGIELSERMLGLLSPLPDYPGYVLRIEQAADSVKYPHIPRFVCRDAVAGPSVGITSEILLEDISEAGAAALYEGCGRVRVQGLGGAATGGYMKTFACLRDCLRGEIEFCPTDGWGFAAALAAEWLMGGSGSEAVTSFGGVGGFAPTEELIMVLKLARLRKPGKAYVFFPEMADLLQKITGDPISPIKPVIGKRIFHVESGIHVDGILKEPECYEPFPPETVGLSRVIVIGRQSGASSVRAKLDEMGVDCGDRKILDILERVKMKSEEKNGALTNEELAEIARGCGA